MEVKEESFWKFIVACLMTGNNTLAKELIKQNKDLVMKSNEAPEKIYFTQTENGTHYYTEGIPFERKYVEYTRTDAFIEKVCEWLKTNYTEFLDSSRLGINIEKLVKDLKNDFRIDNPYK